MREKIETEHHGYLAVDSDRPRLRRPPLLRRQNYAIVLASDRTRGKQASIFSVGSRSFRILDEVKRELFVWKPDNHNAYMQEARSELRDRCRGDCGTFGEDNRVPTHARVRAFLESVAKRRILITYQELANALRILPPNSIHRVTEALEHLMEEDAAADRPFVAALAISKARGGLPGRGFFDCARRLGRFAGDPDGHPRAFHAAELNAVFAYWGGPGDK